MFLLHEEFQKPGIARIRIDRMSRHLYDLFMMTQAEIGEKVISEKALYEELVDYRRRYHKLNWVNYDSLKRTTIDFIPPDEILDHYKADYEIMQREMIYGPSPGFNDLIHFLRHFQSRLRMSL